MGTQERLIARLACAVALGFGVIYLGWRVGATLTGVPFLLGASTLVVEMVGLLAVAVLTWALWRAPAERIPEGIDADVDVIIRCAGAALEQVRATVLASRHLAPITVVDLDARPEVAALALAMGASYVATDPSDIDGLMLAVESTRGSTMLLFDAGDIPRPDVLDRLMPWLDEASVAIVQGMVVSASQESSEHGSGGRHDKEFERRSLGPSLGTRGLARFNGSGSLIRRAALRSLDVDAASTPMVEAEITAALFAQGWKIVAPGGEPVVAANPVASPGHVELIRACEASGARAMLIGRNGAFRFNSLRPSQRLALIAHAVRPLSGLRRSVIIVILLDALLSGHMPVNGTIAGFATLWLPWFVLAALGLWALSEGSLRPGDRVRSSMRVLGASWRGVMAPNGRPDDAKHTLTGAFGLHHGAASAAAIGAIGVVVGLRAFSDRVTHTLATMTTEDRAVLLLVSLWSLGGGLDALRLLARRAQARRATRVVASLPSTIGDRGAMVVDLTPLGAGVLGEFDIEVGARADLEVVLPTVTGCVSATLPVVVRNVRIDYSGEQRVGVEFAAVESYEADALAEFCIVQPALDVLGASTVDVSSAEVRPVTVLDDRVLVPRRIGLRAAALVAVFGALSSSIPTSADASGAALSVMRGEVVVAAATEPVETVPTETVPTDTVPTDTVIVAGDVPPTPGGAADPAGTVVTAVCALEAGDDGSYGTSDDIYGSPVSDVVDADGAYELVLDGEACWYSVAPPRGFMTSPDSTDLESLSTPQVIDLSSVATTTAQVELVVGVDPVESSDVTTTVADVVWADLDANGIVDTGEPVLEGVTVTLYDDQDTVVATVTSATDGLFSFEGVAEGRYHLGVTDLPSGYTTGDLAAGPFGRTEVFEADASGDVNLAIGLQPTVATASGSAVAAPVAADAPFRLLERPEASETAERQPPRSTLPGLVVVLLASIIGFSVVAGSLRPRRVDSLRVRTP
jgi:SdrD B-like domain/Glycosyltransferase like family 2